MEESDKLKIDGYLRVRVPPHVRTLLAKVFEAGELFFNAPLDQKLLNHLPQDAGFRPAGVEYSSSPRHADPIESFSAHARFSSSILKTGNAQALYEQMLAVIRVLEPLAENLTIHLAKSFGDRKSADKLKGSLHSWSCLQLNYSRPAATRSSLIHEAHEDGHLFTLACATGPGLEIQSSDGQFKAAPTEPDEILVMPGDIAWLLSGGKIKPLFHRVRRDSQCQVRMAMLYFCDINPDLCQPWVSNELNKDVEIGERVFANPSRFGLQGFNREGA